ncbi:hypothetical protein KEM52_004322 [Ascosphaera acerosa]|nr:hypothetical protein KEM52_004322 [Ascosphaera acerosa]
MIAAKDARMIQSERVEAMLQPSFAEGATKTIRLKDVTADTFNDFFVWAHSWDEKGAVTGLDEDTLVALAVFTEKYQVIDLHNQVLDRLSTMDWTPNAELLERLYSQVPVTAPILRLSTEKLGAHFNKHVHDYEQDFADEYRNVLSTVPQACWDLMQLILPKAIRKKTARRDCCRYHHHEEKGTNPTDEATTCPYNTTQRLEKLLRNLKLDDKSKNGRTM